MKNWKINHIQNKRRLAEGFTLIEMLLGLSIFSILAVCVFSTYSAGMKISRKAETFNHFYRDVNLSLISLCREIESMVPYNLEDSYPDLSSFEGKNDSLRFVLAEKDGLKMVRYSLIPAVSSHLHQVLIGQTTQTNVSVTTMTERVFGEDYLVREEMPLEKFLEGEDEKGESVVQGTKIKSGGLRFYYAVPQDPSSMGYEWKDSWDFESYPQLIRVEIDYFAQGRGEEVKTISKVIYVPTGTWQAKRSETK